jgi:hypothetical protein
MFVIQIVRSQKMKDKGTPSAINRSHPPKMIGVEKPDNVRVFLVEGVNATNLSGINNLLGENVQPSSTLLIAILPANGQDYYMRVAETDLLLGA